MNEQHTKKIDDIPYEACPIQANIAKSELFRIAWKLIWISLSITGLILFISQALYSLSRARINHDPTVFYEDFIEIPTQHGDPIIDFYARRYIRCLNNHVESYSEPGNQPNHISIDNTCEIGNLLINGEDKKIIDLSKAYKENNEDLEDLEVHEANPLQWLTKFVFKPALRDASSRRDWASCKRYSQLTLAILDNLDATPSEWSSDMNEVIWLATLCDDPLEILLEAELFSFLADQIKAGAHLSDSTLSYLKDKIHKENSSHWMKLISGVRSIRSSAWDEAITTLEINDPSNIGTLADLIRLQLSRALYWRIITNSEARISKEEHMATKRRLDSLSRQTSRASFRSDILEYKVRIANLTQGTGQ